MTITTRQDQVIQMIENKTTEKEIINIDIDLIRDLRLQGRYADARNAYNKYRQEVKQ